MFKFIDLFAGIGGFHVALSALGGECVYACEIDKFACRTYEANFGMNPMGDITTVRPEDVPDHDVLTAGFPCQPFSHGGLRKGFDDTRGTLFYNVADILRVKKPRFAVLENVRGLLSNNKGDTFLTILRTLRELGYKTIVPDEALEDAAQAVEYGYRMLMNSKDFGIPQSRIRLYIVAWRDEDFEYEYPSPSGLPTRLGDILEEDGSAFTLTPRTWEWLQEHKKKCRGQGKGFGYSLFDEDSEYTNTISARYWKDGAEILIRQEGDIPRKLTLREAARLQGFPEEFILPCSKTQTYKQFGNAVTVNVAQAVCANLF